MSSIIVYVTVPDFDEGHKIAEVLLNKQLAACVNMYPIQSVFVWKGETTSESEVVMFIKTTAGMFYEIRDTVRKLHSYELPAIVFWEIKGDEEYLAWIRESVKSEVDKL